MRVVALFRVSTERQANEGASLDAQEREYRDLATRNGWETVAEFRGCESATQAATERRVLQQVLECVRDQSPGAVYVHEQSRLTRGDELEAALLMRELRERGVKIIVRGVVRDLASLDERFMVGIQSLVDRAESERIKERLGRGKAEKARRGLKTGGPAPYGYSNPPPGAPGRGTLQVVEEEAVVVRRIFERSAEGWGVARIESELNALGTPAPRGGKWGKSTVNRVLRCPAYLGVSASRIWVAAKGSRTFRQNIKNDRAIIVENAHQAIITKDLWDRVHGRPSSPRTAFPRLLSGLLWISGLRADSDSENGRAFYRGPRGAAGNPRLHCEQTDAAVWSAFASLATGPEFVARLFAEASNPRQRELALQEVAHLEGQIAKHRKRLDGLVEMRAEGEIDKGTYAAKSEDARRAIARLESELAEQRSKAEALDGSHAARVVKAVQVLLAGRTTLTTAQKRSVLRSIVRRIDVTAERTGATFARDERGRVLPGSSARWAIRGIEFRLALPVAQDAPTAAHARHGGPLGGGGCAQASRTEAGATTDRRTGQLVTIAEGCATRRPRR